MTKTQRTIFIELLVILVLAVGVFIYGAQVDIFEAAVEWIEDHEEYELDEMIPVMIFLFVAFTIFSFRRWSDAEKLRKENQEEKKRLQKALDDIKQLKDLLPICSSCKKIRDDQGYWHNVEKYFSAHSNTEFSHSLCPECIIKLYPDHKESLIPDLKEKKE